MQLHESVTCGLQIHGFRMALWEEHSAIIHPSFYHPSSMECVEQMRNIGKTNWEVRVPVARNVCSEQFHSSN